MNLNQFDSQKHLFCSEISWYHTINQKKFKFSCFELQRIHGVFGVINFIFLFGEYLNSKQKIVQLWTVFNGGYVMDSVYIFLSETQ